MRVFNVRAEWDDEAAVWYVAASDVPGLATEAPTTDALIQKLRTLIPELLELNGQTASDMHVPFELLAAVDGHRQSA